MESTRLDEPIFSALELEEPSAKADGAIFEAAKAHLTARKRRRRNRRAILYVQGAIAVAVGIVAVLLVAGRKSKAPVQPPDERISSAPSDVLVVSLLEDLGELRVALEEIDEMATLIPKDREDARQEIAQRAQLCRSDLERLEEKVREFGSRNPRTPDGKETKA